MRSRTLKRRLRQGVGVCFFFLFFFFPLFKCAVASLYEVVSVRRSVGPYVPCYFRRWKERILGASCAVYPALFVLHTTKGVVNETFNKTGIFKVVEGNCFRWTHHKRVAISIFWFFGRPTIRISDEKLIFQEYTNNNDTAGLSRISSWTIALMANLSPIQITGKRVLKKVKIYMYPILSCVLVHFRHTNISVVSPLFFVLFAALPEFLTKAPDWLSTTTFGLIVGKASVGSLGTRKNHVFI